ncbi:probable plastid-lipid-associated protein 10, chloroplastic isoform X2 [Coffea eugenioides]|uniref:Probable plastid-lipid-associated protein 10, chloroplastic isoform X2 n=2 Tax=Coffea arabica TaxID=13443 RepID=A0A6P6WFH3_COFAR|nr:probable plastid-lipid-associated protein 10, chloroplastic isoform X2 [Coffea arabica]XP_027162069.1 probable plastid-lipid-associated protein 10, chloroplastic isoform X2 [Coffea eugenioides]XP_027185420.1 probable plastid-lipid-associated protein 10, chloroplastic isoform X2 [Coffea eugenioides]
MPGDIFSGFHTDVSRSRLAQKMDVIAFPVCSAAVIRAVPFKKSLVPTPNSSTNVHHQKVVHYSATDAETELEDKKYELLGVIRDTQRGLVTTADQRSVIEEALVSVEAFDAGEAIDLGELDGTWRLQYTSAPDVLILFESAARLPFFQVGQIFQKFECRDESNGGVVRNIVKWSIPSLLEEQEGATLLVSAKFSVVSSRNIYLQFEEIALNNINISEELQALIAPAILPRSFISFQILQFIRAFKAEFPVRNPGRTSVGGLYYLSYLDKNMLLGRAVGGGGVFVFTRAQAIVL